MLGSLASGNRAEELDLWSQHERSIGFIDDLFLKVLVVRKEEAHADQVRSLHTAEQMSVAQILATPLLFSDVFGGRADSAPQEFQ